MKKIRLLLLMLICFQFTYSQHEDASIGIYCGPGVLISSGNLNKYFNMGIGGTMSLVYHRKNMAYYLSINGADGKLKNDFMLSDGNVWKKGSENSFFSYGLSVGYSVFQNIKFKITPFAGIILSESRPQTSELKEFKYLKKVDITPILSPSFGINMNYRLIKMKNIEKSRINSCFTINARALYIPWAVRGNKVPYKGDICYFSIGILAELFNVN
ncbi:hypothetical protein LJC52_05360 [Bacteroidales bacterium OttesenSCG-928-A17]|nr:hypothetical protein [Bacteroidales bacterium OttesenSCG-928-A17]